jgi:hypothetical protein
VAENKLLGQQNKELLAKTMVAPPATETKVEKAAEATDPKANEAPEATGSSIWFRWFWVFSALVAFLVLHVFNFVQGCLERHAKRQQRKLRQ